MLRIRIDPHQREKPDPNPHKSQKQDPKPRKSQKQDPDPHQSQILELWSLKMEPWRPMDAYNGGVEAQNRAEKSQQTNGRKIFIQEFRI